MPPSALSFIPLGRTIFPQAALMENFMNNDNDKRHELALLHIFASYGSAVFACVKFQVSNPTWLTLRFERSGNKGCAPSFRALNTALSTRGRSLPNVRKTTANSLPSCTRSLSSWKKEGRIQWYSRPSSPFAASSLSPCGVTQTQARMVTYIQTTWVFIHLYTHIHVHILYISVECRISICI